VTIIALSGLKGGSGKSTIALHLAGEAVARGQRALVADADPQRTALTLADIAAERGLKGPDVVGVSTGMHATLPQLSAAYAFTAIDCPPYAGAVTRAALMVADVVLLPCGPSPTEFWSLATTLELITEARAIRPELVAAILLNKMNGTSLGKGARAALEGAGVPILRTALRQRVAYAEALVGGQTLASYAPKSEAAAEVRALFDELSTLLPKTRTESSRGKKPKNRKPRAA
jgi:chromosome partitioning protein